MPFEAIFPGSDPGLSMVDIQQLYGDNAVKLVFAYLRRNPHGLVRKSFVDCLIQADAETRLGRNTVRIIVTDPNGRCSLQDAGEMTPGEASAFDVPPPLPDPDSGEAV